MSSLGAWLVTTEAEGLTESGDVELMERCRPGISLKLHRSLQRLGMLVLRDASIRYLRFCTSYTNLQVCVVIRGLPDLTRNCGAKLSGSRLDQIQAWLAC